MNGLVALTIIMVVYAAGDMVATRTKAIISMLFVASVVFAIGFWNGLPGTIFADSQLQTFASVTVGLLLVHMGTTIKVKEEPQTPKAKAKAEAEKAKKPT